MRLTANETYDFAVVGGGVAGLMAALRLARRGLIGCILERGHLGCGATASNHGIIHSGALMAFLHGHLTATCRAAQILFERSFPHLVQPAKGALYFGSHARMLQFEERWLQLGVQFKRVKPKAAASYIRKDILTQLTYALVSERFVNSQQIVAELGAACAAHRVTLLTETAVSGILAPKNGAISVLFGHSNSLQARAVILAAGSGLHSLLEHFGSGLASQIRSRRAAMAAYRCIEQNKPLDRGLVCTDFGGPTIIPVDGVALAGQYGGPQPFTRTDLTHNPDASILDSLRIAQIRYFQDFLDLSTEVTWEGIKTEIDAGKADAWGTEPGFSVTSHQELDGIEGLWTLVPGKMSLTFHATAELLRRMGYGDEKLSLPLLRSGNAPRYVPVAVSPWAELAIDQPSHDPSRAS